MASFKSMNKHGHFTIAIQYYADITFPQLVVANKAGPASRKHACTISDNLQMVYGCDIKLERLVIYHIESVTETAHVPVIRTEFSCLRL